jgi:eukaryotic-like serine/threonine-protein kinase
VASTADPPERRSRVGDVVADKYRLVRLLGEGGMGAVYEAEHTFLGRRFAIKFLHPELLVRGEMMERFRREARAAGSLENEHVVAATDFGMASDGAPYLVMEYLAGENLAELLRRVGPLPVTRAVHAVLQTCKGLEVAHARGIVHRDLKPENLFVVPRADDGDLVKILDFGIAKLQGSDAGPRTRTGVTMGTPHYMPPEQARGEKELDHRADIYALGVILYELLSNKKPHPGASYNEILFHILTQPVAPLASLRSGLPRGLAEVVQRAMAFEISDRPASAAELAAELAPFAGPGLISHPRGQEPPAAGAQSPTFPAAPVETNHPRAGDEPNLQRSAEHALEVPRANGPTRTLRRARWAIAAGLISVVAALGAVAGLGSRRAPAPAASGEPVGANSSGLRAPESSARSDEAPTSPPASVSTDASTVPSGQPSGQLRKVAPGSVPSRARQTEEAPTGTDSAAKGDPRRKFDRENPYGQ